ncbi:hypothetical protein Rcae01_02912 [Novipirellula caenicola]|uniref:Uncharacterized protein n=1 Tax=Novipirellula caenicola TaxID=1536901 RepID=A0ABP9VS24_9BACT
MRLTIGTYRDPDTVMQNARCVQIGDLLEEITKKFLLLMSEFVYNRSINEDCELSGLSPYYENSHFVNSLYREFLFSGSWSHLRSSLSYQIEVVLLTVKSVLVLRSPLLNCWW